MTKESLAALLHGREIGCEMDGLTNESIGSHGLVVVFGSSDDLMEVRGAFDGEYGCDDGKEFHLDHSGVLGDLSDYDDVESRCDRDAPGCFLWDLSADWCGSGDNQPCWSYRTNIPGVVTFDIMEDGNVYCRGLVFHVSDLVPAWIKGTEPRPLKNLEDYDASLIAESELIPLLRRVVTICNQSGIPMQFTAEYAKSGLVRKTLTAADFGQGHASAMMEVQIYRLGTGINTQST